MVSVADIIVSRLIEVVKETKRLPWQRPNIPETINWFSQTRYKGVNRIILGGGEWITFKQLMKYNEAHDTDFKIIKGTKSRRIVFYKVSERILTPDELAKRRADGNMYGVKKNELGQCVLVSFILRYYSVFSVADIENSVGGTLESRFNSGGIVQSYSPCEPLIEHYLTHESIKLVRNNVTPYFGENPERIVIPDVSCFSSLEEYYRTIFHEVVHSTGVTSRLNRSCFVDYAKRKQERSKEEIIAEIGSLLLASECGFTEEAPVNNSEAYIQGWIAYFTDKAKEVIEGMNAAEKAVSFILQRAGYEQGDMDEDSFEEQ